MGCNRYWSHCGVSSNAQRTAPRTARFDSFVKHSKPIKHNSYSILAVQRSSSERVCTSRSHGMKPRPTVSPLRQRGPPRSKDCLLSIFFQLQLLCQLLIFLEKLIDFLNVIIRLHGQCCFVNWSDNLLFFFQVICYFCHALVLLQQPVRLSFVVLRFPYPLLLQPLPSNHSHYISLILPSSSMLILSP